MITINYGAFATSAPATLEARYRETARKAGYQILTRMVPLDPSKGTCQSAGCPFQDHFLVEDCLGEGACYLNLCVHYFAPIAEEYPP